MLPLLRPAQDAYTKEKVFDVDAKAFSFRQKRRFRDAGEFDPWWPKANGHQMLISFYIVLLSGPARVHADQDTAVLSPAI